MAVKEWTNVPGANSEVNMPDLIDGQDVSRVSQLHALRDALIAVEGQIWFRWIGDQRPAGHADAAASIATQFGTRRDGAGITAASVTAVSAMGRNWLRYSITNDGLAGNERQASILPILATPPSDDYSISADVVIRQVTSDSHKICGPSLGVRFVYVSAADVKAYFLTHVNIAGSDVFTIPLHDQILKFKSIDATNHGNGAGNALTITADGTLFGGFGVESLIPAVDNGMQSLSLAVRSNSGVVELERRYHNKKLYRDTSTPYTAKGQACLMMSGHNNNSVQTTIADFSRIECRTLPVLA